MAEVYASLVRKGLKEIKDVPEAIREQVKAILALEGAE